MTIIPDIGLVPNPHKYNSTLVNVQLKVLQTTGNKIRHNGGLKSITNAYVVASSFNGIAEHKFKPLGGISMTDSQINYAFDVSNDLLESSFLVLECVMNSAMPSQQLNLKYKIIPNLYSGEVRW